MEDIRLVQRCKIQILLQCGREGFMCEGEPGKENREQDDTIKSISHKEREEVNYQHMIVSRVV